MQRTYMHSDRCPRAMAHALCPNLPCTSVACHSASHEQLLLTEEFVLVLSVLL